LGPFDHGQRDAQRLLCAVEQRTAIDHIHLDPLHHRVLPGHWFEHLTGSVPIGRVGGLNHRLQHQSSGINEQMALATAQFLGSIVAAWPALSVVLAL
jgi:hypothetical protein